MTEKNYPNQFSLKGKVAVVTGGAGLIGTPVSIGLAQAGAKVYVADISKKAAKELVKKNENLDVNDRSD